MSTDNKTSKPLYFDHRKRIKQKYLNDSLQAFSDYEVLELLLTYSIHRKDVKPVAKKLLSRFKTFQGVLEATLDELVSVEEIGEHSAILLKLTKSCSDYYLRNNILKKDVISSPGDLLNYLKSSMACLDDEQFRVIYLNSKNELIHEETVQEGTVDQTAVYPRKIMERSLKKKAVSLIFVHNHPSGNPSPSEHDKNLTSELCRAARTLEIKVHDHIIIGRNSYFSFSEEGIM